jgi:hypothetical protein
VLPLPYDTCPLGGGAIAITQEATLSAYVFVKLEKRGKYLQEVEIRRGRKKKLQVGEVKWKDDRERRGEEHSFDRNVVERARETNTLGRGGRMPSHVYLDKRAGKR